MKCVGECLPLLRHQPNSTLLLLSHGKQGLLHFAAPSYGDPAPKTVINDLIVPSGMCMTLRYVSTLINRQGHLLATNHTWWEVKSVGFFKS